MKTKPFHGISTGSPVVITLDQQYNVGEKPTVILYTCMNRHAGTPDKKQKQNRNNVVVHHQTELVLVIIHCCFIDCKDKASTWHLNGFPDSSNLGSTV